MVSRCYRLSLFLRPGRKSILPLIFLSLTLYTRLVFAEPMMWEVRPSEGGGRAYLFGSIHFGTSELYPLPDYVLAAFNDSEALVVELDMDQVSTAQASQILIANGRLPKGETLKSRLTQSQWDDLLEIARYVGLPAPAFQRLRPWMVAVQLTAAKIRRSGFSEEYGVDKHMLELAKSQTPAKPIIELETFAQQMALFEGLDGPEEVAFLLQSMDEFHKTPASLMAIIHAWSQGDEAVLEELISGAFNQPLTGEPMPNQPLAQAGAEVASPGAAPKTNAGLDPVAQSRSASADDLYQRIFTDRNVMMQKQIADRIREGERLFVVVGAGHVLGDDGLKTRLEQEGFRVRLQGSAESEGLK